MDIPEWATDVLRFESGVVVYYNNKQWEYVSNDEVDRGKWNDEEHLEEYLTGLEGVHNYTHELLNFSLENK